MVVEGSGLPGSVVEVLRRFNRSYTQRIGVLDESYLGTGRSLGPSRLLFEIDPDGTAVVDLRGRLGLDSGYLSRLLRQLEAERLVAVVSDPSDRRRRVVRLTGMGRAERATIDARSEALAQQLVASLSDRQRSELATALESAERLLRAATASFDVVDPRSRDARWAIGEYFAELDERFPTGFDADIARDEADEAAAFTPPAGVFVLIRSDGDTVGCGGLQALDASTFEIKRMWIHPEWRGSRLGRRMVQRLEQLAAEAGATRVVLDTNDSLTEAIAMYAALGYDPTERYNANPYAQRWFTKQLQP